jgi:putative hydrolase of the HAD superfamily
MCMAAQRRFDSELSYCDERTSRLDKVQRFAIHGSTMSPRNVIFDLGGVLLDWNPGWILSQFYPDHATQQLMREAIFGHADSVAFDRGEISKTALIHRLRQRTGRSRNELRRVLDAAKNSLVEKPDTVAVLKALHERGVPLYCLSNMPISAFRHVRRRCEFWDLFRGIVVSGEVRMVKPERAIFKHLLLRYGIIAEETIFIDDHAPNIAGARDVGLETILFCDAAQCRRDLCARLGLDGL